MYPVYEVNMQGVKTLIAVFNCEAERELFMQCCSEKQVDRSGAVLVIEDGAGDKS